MSDQQTPPEFTGEYFVPGSTNDRIEADHRERYRFAMRHAKDKRVLDIACGIGYSAPMLLEAGAQHYHGVDINADLVEHARTTYGSDQAVYEVGDVCLFDPGTRFDLITCFETIEHVSEYKKAIDRLYHLLEPGGVLLISSPNRPITSPKSVSLTDPPKNKFHTQEFTPDELASILREQGFVVSDDAIFGQRLRTVFPFKLLNRIKKLVLGNPDSRTSPEVRAFAGKTPRYFVIRASKPAV